MLGRAVQEAGYYETQTQAGKDQVVTAYEALIDEVSDRLTAVVDLSPRGKIAVVGDPNNGGYYVPGSRDGSRPGAFHAYVGGAQVYKFAMATTAYHEAVPGHGFQTTIGMELEPAALPHRPLFQRLLRRLGAVQRAVGLGAGNV